MLSRHLTLEVICSDNNNTLCDDFINYFSHRNKNIFIKSTSELENLIIHKPDIVSIINSKTNVEDLKIIENFDIQENEDFEIDEEENTISILNRYIDESEFEGDKTVIKGILQQIYAEACEVE